MPDSFYKERMSDLDIIELFKSGLYTADLEKGLVFNTKGSSFFGKEITSYKGNKEGHRYIRLYANGKKRSTALHRVIWIVGCGSPIPDGWEVHHYNLDTEDNSFSNLFVLHPVDHSKLHGRGLISHQDIPF